MFIGIKPVPLRLGFTVCGALTFLGSVLGLNLQLRPDVTGVMVWNKKPMYPLVNIQKAIENGHL
jgi:hypothetical protein